MTYDDKINENIKKYIIRILNVVTTRQFSAKELMEETLKDIKKYPFEDFLNIIPRYEESLKEFKGIQRSIKEILGILDELLKYLKSPQIKRTSNVTTQINVTISTIKAYKQVLTYYKDVEKLMEREDLSFQELFNELADLRPDNPVAKGELSRGIPIAWVLAYFLLAPKEWEKSKVAFNMSQEWCKYITDSIPNDFDMNMLDNLPYDNFYVNLGNARLYVKASRETKSVFAVLEFAVLRNDEVPVTAMHIFDIGYDCKADEIYNKSLVFYSGYDLLRTLTHYLNPLNVVPSTYYLKGQKGYVSTWGVSENRKKGNKELFKLANLGNFWSNEDFVSYTAEDPIKTKYGTVRILEDDKDYLDVMKVVIEENNINLPEFQDMLPRLVEKCGVMREDLTVEELKTIYDDVYAVSSMNNSIEIVLGALVYLSSENTLKMVNLNKKLNEPKISEKVNVKRRGKQVSVAKNVNVMNVAIKENDYYVKVINEYKHGNVYRHTEGKGTMKSTHIRKAHPHSYWVGKRDSADRHKIVKFLMPTVVNKELNLNRKINVYNVTEGNH